MGLVFNLDLLGYGIMALSTSFIGLAINVQNKKDKVLKMLLLIHGIFFIGCLITPMMGYLLIPTVQLPLVEYSIRILVFVLFAYWSVIIFTF